MTDTGRLTLDFRLESLSSRPEEGPVASRFSCVCIPAYLYEYVPSIREVAALHELTRNLQQNFNHEAAD